MGEDMQVALQPFGQLPCPVFPDLAIGMIEIAQHFFLCPPQGTELHLPKQLFKQQIPGASTHWPQFLQ